MSLIGITLALGFTYHIILQFFVAIYKKLNDYKLNHPKRKKSPKYIAGKPKF